MLCFLFLVQGNHRNFRTSKFMQCTESLSSKTLLDGNLNVGGGENLLLRISHLQNTCDNFNYWYVSAAQGGAIALHNVSFVAFGAFI